MPVSSGIISTRSTPSAPRAPSMRCTMFDFSAVGKTDAWLTNRRMSRPEAGFATIPTVPQTGKSADALRENLKKVKLPPGFKIDLYGIVPDARMMAVAPSTNMMFVGTRKTTVWAVTDRTSSGHADEVKPFAPSLKFKVPNGVCWTKDGFLIVRELNRATKAGLHFGFPWYGGGKTRTAEYKDAKPPADAVFPELEMAPHAADLGMTFYTGTKFPQKYQNGIFIAEHGSWNRTTPIGARVMFVSLKPNGSADKAEVFAEGWLDPETKQYRGRPADVAVMRDGSLLVSDDFAGAIYRITYVGE